MAPLRARAHYRWYLFEARRENAVTSRHASAFLQSFSMSLQTHGIINLGNSVPFASPMGMEWSDDGQLLVVTKSVLYILVREASAEDDRTAVC